MSGKPWLETHDHADVRETLVEEGYTEEWVALFTAAPAMVRALCLVEWEDASDTFTGDEFTVCSVCEAWEDREHEARYAKRVGTFVPGPVTATGHNPECLLDQALTSAGLDAAAREEVRKMGGVK